MHKVLRAHCADGLVWCGVWVDLGIAQLWYEPDRRSFCTSYCLGSLAMGYKAICVDGKLKAVLTCIHCKDLLRSPVQTEEGHRLCKTCFNTIKG